MPIRREQQQQIFVCVCGRAPQTETLEEIKPKPCQRNAVLALGSQGFGFISSKVSVSCRPIITRHVIRAKPKPKTCTPDF